MYPVAACRGHTPLSSVTFTPTDVAGLKLWLKGDGVFWQDGARTTPATADGDPVGAWDDASGEDNHATQATANARPLLKLNVKNGLPVVRFDGTDDFLSSLLTVAQPGTVFIVASRSATGERHMIDGTTELARWLVGGDVGGNWVIYAGSVVTTSAQDTNWHLHTAVFDGASSSHRVDAASAGSGDAGALALTNPLIGAGQGHILFHQGDIAEVLIYDSALGTTDRDSVEAYLDAKYSIF